MACTCMLQRSAWCEDTTVGRCVTLQTALQGVAWVALHPASSFIQREVNVRLQFDRAWAYCEKPAAPARVLVQKNLTNIFEWGWNHPLVFDCPTDCLLNGQPWHGREMSCSGHMPMLTIYVRFFGGWSAGLMLFDLFDSFNVGFVT